MTIVRDGETADKARRSACREMSECKLSERLKRCSDAADADRMNETKPRRKKECVRKNHKVTAGPLALGEVLRREDEVKSSKLKAVAVRR